MEMASTCSVDRVLLGLESIRNNQEHILGWYARDAIKHMKFLKTFLMCARKWSLVHLYLQSDNVVKKVSLPSFLSCIEDTFHKYEEDIRSLSLRLETEKDECAIHDPIFDSGVSREIEKKITSLRQEIIQIYFALASSRSFQSNSCMTDDELLEFIDLILQNLADLTNDNKNWQISDYGPLRSPLSAQVQDLEAKLTFLKSFILFAKMQGAADIPALLLAHFEVVALTAARLSYKCSFWDEFEAKHDPEFYDRSTCSFKLLSIRAVDFHVYEIYKEVLAASNSSASLHTAVMDERILNNFNDSLIGRLWELLCCSSSFVDSMKDEMQKLYAGLRFLRSILREHHEMMDEQNEKIGALLGEAGIIIFAPTLSRVIEGEVSFSGSTQVLDLLANTNIHIQHFKDQISGSGTIESLPNSSHSLRAPEVSQTSSRMLSKGKVPIDHEVMVGLDDEGEQGIEPLIKEFKDRLRFSSTMQSLPNSSHSLRAPEVSQTSSRMLSKGKMPIAREVMVGLDDEAEKVIVRLVRGSKQVEIVPIVGMAGIGKTTLAKKVYNDSSVIHNFHIRLWCTVSQEFNMKNVLLQILCSDGKHSRKDEFQNLDEDALLEKLRQRLLKNRYLVVFDDVWDIKVWNELRNAFPNDKKGSRIIFTSRFSNVQYGGEPHHLRPLSEKESFELLQKKVFGKEDCPQAMHGLGMEIAKKCMGLPLALVVVAGVLATIEHDICVWEEFAESLTWAMVSGADQCKKSLELSYEHLPYHLKACLLYFAAFREDEKIGVQKLMCLWIAEGFVEKIEGKRSEDIAEEYLMELIGRNLVMVGKNRSIGGVKTCYIHDLVFEFCKGEAKEKNFLQVLRGYDELSTFNVPPNLPRLSICSSGKNFVKSRLFCPHLASLLFFNAAPGYNEFKLSDITFLFRIYKHLNVLNLEGIYLTLKELPAEVESLLCLRYLALEGRGIHFIPPSIAELSHLETLCLYTRWMVLLPDSIWTMKKLRHIRVRNLVVIRLSSNDNIVENLSTLPNLDTFSCLSLYGEGENLLRRIPNVRRLKISDCPTGVLNMSRLECLESLSCLGKYPSLSREHLELSFPMNLKKLTLKAVDLPCSKMSLVERLPNLEVLKLRNGAMDGQRWELLEGGFPKLRVLTLEYAEVAEWTEAGPDSDSDDYFPCLQQLKLHRINHLKIMPACLESISTLETINVSLCIDGVKSLVRKIEAAQNDWGNENLKIIIID